MGNNGCLDFSICTIQGNLWMSVPRTQFAKLISAFKCNEKGQLFIVQTADDEYLRKIEKIGGDFVKTYPQAYKSIQFLRDISRNEKFLIVSGKVNEDTSLNNYTEINKKVHEINGIKFPINSGEIAKLYNIYYWGDKTANIGEIEKKKRVCRFCGEQFSKTVTFKKKAHAISQSLGNKLLYCNEECDDCNGRFSAIEKDFFNVHHLLYSLYQKKGKDGLRNYDGKKIEIDNKYKNGLITIKTDFLSTDIINGFQLNFGEQCSQYSGQNIYRCLCKFAISLIDKRYLEKLSDTILWIRQKKTINNLQAIWRRPSAFHDQPILALNLKKAEAEKELPEFIVRLFMLDIEYLFVLPIVDSVPVVLSESAKIKLNELFGLSDYLEMDLSSNEKMDVQISFKLELQEGTEIVSIEKSEYDSLSDEERLAKYPNASGFSLIDDSKS